MEWCLQDNQFGHRKHFAKSNSDHRPVRSRLIALTEQLIPQLLSTLEAVPEADLDQPLAHPFVEIGYTMRAWKRRDEHASHIGTAFALALIEEIAALEFPQKKYRWRYAVIAECRHDEGRWNMECFFSRLCRSYFWLGGFNGTTAGFATFVGEVSNENTTDAKQMCLMQSDRALAAMDFRQIAANIKADHRKLNTLKANSNSDTMP